MNALLAIDSAVQAERRLTLREIDELHKARAAVVDAVEALKLAERTISATLAARGYQNGECTDGWVQEVRDEVAALVPIRAALSRCGGAK